ncbi:TetR/AcrR family transcriptional regulator [Echinicola marina]|uniref:TetR/AcrR family transcriptional regulator n=1 Tax=Echinicola marina TaxID=2859768 RepID=UPI001CF717B9|nr:TetR/AcrR family transcriptional regulator [Echinicola marina]UCS94662.1 TetR/AcrR family transcriptional regulator [Echinicola marina]
MEKKKKISTKNKIINAAIKLYNENGAQNVTSRHIAAELGISHGNLDYHFNNREALLLAIYDHMRKEMGPSYSAKEEGKNAFEQFHLLLQHLEKFQTYYSFFNLDILEISRANPKVSKVLQETLELRKSQIRDYFGRFVKEGLMEDRMDSTYLRLQHTIRILITFWLSQKEVLSNYAFNEAGEMSLHIWELMEPYMTKEGKVTYKDLITSK